MQVKSKKMCTNVETFCQKVSTFGVSINCALCGGSHEGGAKHAVTDVNS